MAARDASTDPDTPTKVEEPGDHQKRAAPPWRVAAHITDWSSKPALATGTGGKLRALLLRRLARTVAQVPAQHLDQVSASLGNQRVVTGQHPKSQNSPSVSQ